MELILESQKDYLLATVTGRVSAKAVHRIFKHVIDTATERGFDKVLIDFSEVMGELAVMDLYELGKATAEYCLGKELYPKLALIGKPPLVTGFGAEVASNRGLPSKTFSDRQSALNWLRALTLKAPGS